MRHSLRSKKPSALTIIACVLCEVRNESARSNTKEWDFFYVESEAKERVECKAYNVVKPAYDGTARDRTYSVVGKVWLRRVSLGTVNYKSFPLKTCFHYAQIPFQRGFTVQNIMQSNYSAARL